MKRLRLISRETYKQITAEKIKKFWYCQLLFSLLSTVLIIGCKLISVNRFVLKKQQSTYCIKVENNAECFREMLRAYF
ncbi:MAG TPA: hypothetical protein DEP27_06775 [Ruminococcaceae bacterium]|nr:hypothetical protein [Oscillospiraceae bacterium]